MAASVPVSPTPSARCRFRPGRRVLPLFVGCSRPTAVPAWSFAVKRAYLDRVVPGERMRRRELDRLLAISAADDVEAGDELLGLDERPVAEQRLPVPDPDRPGCVGALQRVAQDL